MMRTRFLLLLAMMLATAAPLWSADSATTVRVFRLNFVSVLEASQAVQPMLSEGGSMTLQPHQSRLTIQDSPEVVTRVAKTLKELDRRPDSYHLQVELLKGSTGPFPEGNETEVESRLRRMFKFTSYQRLGSADFQGEIGDRAVANLGSKYRIRFAVGTLGMENEMPWGIPNPGSRIELRPLVLERVVEAGSAHVKNVEVLRTRVILSAKQEVFIGAGGSEESSTGLVLILREFTAGGR